MNVDKNKKPTNKLRRFKFKGRDENQKMTTGIIEATSVKAAVTELQKMGIKSVIINGKDPFQVSTDSSQKRTKKKKRKKLGKLFKKFLLELEPIEFAGLSLCMLMLAGVMFKVLDSIILNKYLIVLSGIFLLFLFIIAALLSMGAIVKGLKEFKIGACILGLLFLYPSLHILYVCFTILIFGDPDN